MSENLTPEQRKKRTEIHVIVRDEKGWPYDIRKCFTCGKDLGLV